MKRIFTLGPAADRKTVMIEVNGSRVGVTQKKSDGGTKRNEKELPSEAEARSECERMVRELTTRGFVEQTAAVTSKAGPAAWVPKAAQRARQAEKGEGNRLSGGDEPPPVAEGLVLRRLGPAPGAAPADPKSKKKKAGSKKKGKKGETGDALDKRVLAAVGAGGVACVALVGFLLYDAFFKPSSVVGTWAGSMIDYEIGKPIVHTQYRLVLDEQRRASLTLQEKFTSLGTYTLQG
ncbi:MAG: hypothetical protein LC745_13430, partial [Planctomycetia bacterium]|nr:hypothetical protein [Planctomycetia bacterium]